MSKRRGVLEIWIERTTMLADEDRSAIKMHRPLTLVVACLDLSDVLVPSLMI